MNRTVTPTEAKRSLPASADLSDLASFRAAYASARDPADVVREVYRRIDASDPSHVWISLLPLDAALGMLADAWTRKSKGEDLPLFGVPFGVKDWRAYRSSLA
jgi:allophanate hydrolase